MTGPKNTSLVALSAGFVVLVSCSVSEACWWKCRSAAPASTYPGPTYTDAYPYPAAAGPVAGPAVGPAVGPTVGPTVGAQADFRKGTVIGPPLPPCEPGMVPVACDPDNGQWKEVPRSESVGCALPSLVGTSCVGPQKKKPFDDKDDRKANPKDDVRERIEPMVCDAQTRKFRRPNPGETPHAYLPAWYLGKPCALPKS